MTKRITKPLKGHPYHNKSDDELSFILRDARQAADNFRGWNDQAECKYLDQYNDAATVLGYRTALIYRKQYGI